LKEKKSHVMNKDATDKDRDRLPPLNALRHFEAVARYGSFAAAAANLHVTHWAVGKQIRLLEDWFGVPLFGRHARGVTLTDDGATLLNEVSNTFGRLAGTTARLRRNDVARRVSGIVRINVPPSFALYWLLPRLSDFRERHPEIDVRVSTTSRKLRYIGDAFDIGVRVGEEQGTGLISRLLTPDMRLPACSPALLRRNPVQNVADLRRHTLLHSSSTGTAWSRWLHEAGAPDLRAAHHVTLDHTYLQLAAAVEGLGMALASLPLIERDIAAGRLVCPIAAPAWHAADYILVTNADRGDDRAVLAFEQWITALAGPSPEPLAPA
jgi:DNA-binding transcriptional LysR family regulator